jgi:hypothetical protein
LVDVLLAVRLAEVFLGGAYGERLSKTIAKGRGREGIETHGSFGSFALWLWCRFNLLFFFFSLFLVFNLAHCFVGFIVADFNGRRSGFSSLLGSLYRQEE